MKYVLRRIAMFLVALLAISLIVFLMLRVLPGDIAAVMAGTNSPPERVAQLRAQMGLDKPLPQQYFEWVGGLLHGDFGMTMLTGQPVASVVASRAAITFPLIVLGMLVALLFGIPLGYLAVRTTNRAAKALFQTIAIIGGAIPALWGGLLLSLLFAHLGFGHIIQSVYPILGAVCAGLLLLLCLPLHQKASISDR